MTGVVLHDLRHT